jgi:hypothetical protein
VNEDGDFAPLFFIIRHSVSSATKPDQSGMKVIQDLHKRDDGFGLSNGWKLEKRSKELTIYNKKKVPEKATHIVWYIIHETTRNVITSQYKAWNDTVRMCMWLELVMMPIQKRDGKLLLWMDNCGCHKTFAVEELMAALEMDVASLPPNMTHILQVLDLVVNGPLKAHTRNLRAFRIVKYFKGFRIEYLENDKLPLENRKKMKFAPPKPTMVEGIQDLTNLFEGDFKLDKFKQSIARSFVNTGTAPSPLDDSFKEHNSNDMLVGTTGTTKIIPNGTQHSIRYESKSVQEAFNLYLDEDADDDDNIDWHDVSNLLE